MSRCHANKYWGCSIYPLVVARLHTYDFFAPEGTTNQLGLLFPYSESLAEVSDCPYLFSFPGISQLVGSPWVASLGLNVFPWFS